MTMTGARGPALAERPRADLPSTPLTWQRTDIVGTELVFPRGSRPSGSAIVAGKRPYALTWQAELSGAAEVDALHVTTRGDGWSRELRLGRAATGWTCRAEHAGDAGDLPFAGTEQLDALDPAALLRLADSPIFVSWAVRRLGLTAKSGPVTVPVVRVQVPSLTVVPGQVTYHLVSPQRLRISGDFPAATVELDDAGMAVYQAGRMRLAR
ncbi:putative glycolipid-binding domain-containing protein [Actinoplanes oblitus]|uniref:Glycolipid-binding domain-containing protein n=1 Tax=Actinoplanes oblitus TaxID=3040509 RepID=A0ABY8WQK0_9ACTN|nr:putative glycolipid-binding domain-containing protein [Actinoplanes oblitus]WIM99087.1 putative glycolipid-binding domain-containing protein [Actinoplanes oblitus]